MQRSIYALIVGINDYNPPVAKLGGAVSDATKIKDYLVGNYTGEVLHIKTLINNEATHANVVSAFRTHLAKATSEDVVWFHYSGHGSRQPSAKELIQFNSGGKDETLVLYDSRPSGRDLADKELSVLLSELDQTGAHVVVTLDCCNSGSGTRSADKPQEKEYRTRLADDRTDARSIDTYLDGYFVKNGVQLPTSNHILFAACNRFQESKESWSGSGLFTESFLKALNTTGKDVSYADLYVKLRQDVVGMNWNQDPQMEPMGKFNSYGKFLDGKILSANKRYTVSFFENAWKMDAGEILGFSAAEGQKVFLFKEGEDIAVTEAVITETSAQISFLKPDIVLDSATKYWALPTKNIFIPTKVLALVDDSIKQTWIEALKDYPNFDFSFKADQAIYSYTLKEVENFLELWNDETEPVRIAKIVTANPQVFPYLMSVLDHAAHWTRIKNFQNLTSQLQPTSSNIYFEIMVEPDVYKRFDPGEINLVYKGKPIKFRLMIQNYFTQNLHYSLIYLNDHYGVIPVKNEALEKSETATLFWGGGEADYFELLPGLSKSTDRFLIIISTERTDDFHFKLDDLNYEPVLSAGFRSIPGLNRPSKVKGAWYTTSFTINITN
ncbi:MAG: caspase family protein [Saprospiraceae bacterium]|nr:caspase family protein [Saprospiraceae bacterium]